MAGVSVDVNLRNDVEEEQTVNVITSDMVGRLHEVPASLSPLSFAPLFLPK
jgi:hypothetical protein